MSFPEKPTPKNVARVDHIRGSRSHGRWLIDNTWTVRTDPLGLVTLSPHFTHKDDVVRMAFVGSEYVGMVPEGHGIELRS